MKENFNGNHPPLWHGSGEDSRSSAGMAAFVPRLQNFGETGEKFDKP
jgi:hypothetical protein